MKAQRYLKELLDHERIALFEDLKGIISEYNPLWIEQECGVTDQTIYNWLSGKTRKPRLDTIVKVAKAVGYEVTLRKITSVTTGKRTKLTVVK